MTFITESTSYKIPVDDIGKIGSYDGVISDKDSLFMQLDKIQGVFSTDYNGHFGDFVYLSIEKENNNVHTKQKIENIINKFVVDMETNYHKYY